MPLKPRSNLITTLLIALLSAALLLAACSGPSPNNSSLTTQNVTAPGSSPPAPKTLHLGFDDEPVTLYQASGVEGREHGDIFHAGLTFYDSTGTLLPKLATKVPSIADGDWLALADGTMEVTWKLKPSLKWHDGAPLTAEDFDFTFRVLKDPASIFTRPQALGFASEVLAPDAQSIVVRYARIYNQASVAGLDQFPPLPRHLLEEAYTQVGAEGLANLPLWTTAWVGLGPFKLTNRSLGSQLEAAAFDDFVFGRPRIDRLVIKYFTDVSALSASLQSGDSDMLPVGGLAEAVQFSTVKRQWESEGRGTVVVTSARPWQMQLQFRDPSLPWASDLRVRQALVHLIDRQGIVDGVLEGLSTVADLSLLPSSPAYEILLQRGRLPKFAYDRALAERLLDAAGWLRGGDGVRRNAAGTAFTFKLLSAGEAYTRQTLVMVDGFKAGGISAELSAISQSATNANEQRAQADGVTRPATQDDSFWNRFLAAQTSSAANRWAGANTGGFSNPEFEQLFSQWAVALDPELRHQREADLHQLLIDEVAYLPLFYEIQGFAYRKGLVGPKPFSPLAPNSAIDIYTWTLD